MFTTPQSEESGSHAQGNERYTSSTVTTPTRKIAQMSAAVAMETTLDTLSPRAGVRHRYRIPGHEDEGSGSPPMLDDADIAAGHFSPGTIKKSNKLSGIGGSEADFLALTDSEDDVEDSYQSNPEAIRREKGDFDSADKFLVLGIDISHRSRKAQFLLSASGVFFFSLLYGFFQELISVQIFGRKLGMFLAASQFSIYTAWSYLLRTFVHSKGSAPTSISSSPSKTKTSNAFPTSTVPITMYIGLSLIRALDLAMTNLAMQYINYPAKTLMKSSRIIWTMMFGVIVLKKKYKIQDYAVVLLMVTGLAIFMHADANSSTIFDMLGVVMLTVSLICDGAVSNMSEAIMNQFNVCQDEFIFNLYSIATIAIVAGAIFNGDLFLGFERLLTPGTLAEIEAGEMPTWSVTGKITVLFLFSTTGFFGSSCSAAITKNFGALITSITSTVRKATTLFLSFAFFPNTCTLEHIVGIVLFLLALVGKTLKASKSGHHHKKGEGKPHEIQTIEMGGIDNKNSGVRHRGRGDHIV
mmetsp:Transcript_34348/g.45963  ORF Transcript_34348/g.45963 Transcript_34348/m.45963 type:complete len:524 (-) Transcript_34348:22-1593(-)